MTTGTDAPLFEKLEASVLVSARVNGRLRAVVTCYSGELAEDDAPGYRFLLVTELAGTAAWRHVAELSSKASAHVRAEEQEDTLVTMFVTDCTCDSRQDRCAETEPTPEEVYAAYLEWRERIPDAPVWTPEKLTALLFAWDEGLRIVTDRAGTRWEGLALKRNRAKDTRRGKDLP